VVGNRERDCVALELMARLLRLEPATEASLPSPRFPGEQAGVTDDWCTAAALAAVGR
jgi:hypothetical protein